MGWRLRVLHPEDRDPECVAIYEKSEPFECQVSGPVVRTDSTTTENIGQSTNTYLSRDTAAFLIETEILEQGFVHDSVSRGSTRFGNGRYPKKLDISKLRITGTLASKMLITSECLDLALRSIFFGSAQYPDGIIEKSPFVSEPYICFMHHYERIDQFAEGYNTNVSRAENSEGIARAFDVEVAIKHMKTLRATFLSRTTRSISLLLTERRRLPIPV